MSYVDKHLAPDEHVVFVTRLHPVIFTSAAGFAAFVVLAAALIIRHNDLPSETNRLVALVGGAIAVVSLIPPFVRWQTSEFAVTDRRVLVKVGFLSVHTVELLLAKVEAIGVDQTLGGRLLGYGTLRITGTGGTVESFPLVAWPLMLRDAVLGQTQAAAPRRH